MKRKITPLCTADYTQPAINIYLERLGLNGYKDAIDAALLQCEQNNVSPRQAVERILAVIAKCRDSQKIEMLMKMARLCPAMTWENFNFSRVQTRQKKVLTELSNCHWIARGENILFYGPSGLGKTHLSVALGKRAIALGGYSVLFKEASKLFEELRTADSQGSYTRRLNILKRVDLLIIDDLSYAQRGGHPEDAANFYALMNGRMGKSTIITSNRPMKEWAEPLGGDEVCIRAGIDRFIARCHHICFKGRSYRLESFLTQAEKDSETEVLNPDESGQTTAGLEELDGIQSETEGGDDDGH